ncbi:CotS family spore coat protein [Gottfriedia acidiceleris]|uniref:CotS family spore coat protein n=1 Tax=Gottfriedia acidiceleris TaxID=371036 RepID=UPI003D1BA6D2
MDNFDSLVNDLELGKKLMNEFYPSITINEIKIIQGGGIKTIWKIESSIGTICLKRIRKNIPIVNFTTAAQDYLYQKGALVARIIPTKDNELFFVHEGFGLVLYEWIDGTDLDMEENQEHLDIGLKGLAQFHLDSVGFAPPDDWKTYDRMGAWPRHYNTMLEEMKEWKIISQSETSEFHQAFLTSADEMIEMAQLAVDMLNNSTYTKWVDDIGKFGYMCHQDYGKGNALQTEKGVYILDLDNLAYDIPLRDVRKLIVGRIEELGAWDLEEMERLIDVYASVFPLTEDQRKIIYIDMLYPHKFYGYVKKPFKKKEAGELKKLNKSYIVDKEKIAVLKLALNIN